MADSESRLPSFLEPAFVVEIPARPAASYPWQSGYWRARLNPDHGELQRPFTMPEQSQTNWCWAATGVALDEFNNGRRGRQCEMAQKVRDPPGVDCCLTPGDPDCDTVETISKVLDALQIRRRPFGPPAGRDVILQDISDDRPIICLLSDGATDHFVVIVAWFEAEGDLWLKVDDPADGLRHRVPYWTLREDYRGRSWEQTTRVLL
jgi:hypothetical protein